jgi:integrase
MALTDTAIRNLKAGLRPRKVSDSGWLYLHVMPSGSRIWRMGYRFDGKEQTLTLGTYPQLSLVDARRLRDQAHARLKSGEDPSIPDSKEVRPVTFGECAQDWHRRWSVNVTKPHAALVWRRLEANVLPALGPLSITDVSPKRILSALQPMEERGALDMLKRARQHIAEITAMAMASGLIQSDPSYRLEKAVTRPRKTQHFSRMLFSEMGAFMEKLLSYDGDPMTREALLFVILTWTRTNEVRFARWGEIQGDVWRIPAQRMKAGREHLIPLSLQAQELLRRLPRSPRHDFIFWSRSSKTGAISENTMLYALHRMGYHRKATVHGFRSTASTWANEQMLNEAQRRYDYDWIELALSHVEANKVRGAYNSATYLQPRRRMLQDWADALIHPKSD